MDAAASAFSQDVCDATRLLGVIDATTPPGETEPAAHARRAMIVAMFRTFEATDAMESMIACHCITLQFVLNGAMRDAGNMNLDPALLNRTRATAMSISKALHLWMTKYEQIHARNEARAAEQAKPSGPPDRPVTLEPASAPVPVKPPPARPDQPGPRPASAETRDAPPPAVGSHAEATWDQPEAAMPGTTMPDTANAPLSAAALRPAAPPHARLSAAPGT
jgi:hypothetical protein